MHVFIKHLAINLTYVKLILTLHNNFIVGIILTNTNIIMSNLIFTCISINPEKIFGGKVHLLIKRKCFTKQLLNSLLPVFGTANLLIIQRI